MTLNDRVKGVYEWFKQREKELHAEAAKNEGKLEKHNIWRLSYYNHPYLILEEDNIIKERFIDVFNNCVDINDEGKITPSPAMEDDGRFSRIFTEIIEETNWRGILTNNNMFDATDQIRTYYKDGTPIGVHAFKKYTNDNGQWLLKFSKKQYVDEMFRFGRFRISPASYYARGSHLRAVKDLETARDYKLKALSEVLEGKKEIEYNGQKIPIIRGTVPIQFMMDDYYLFSTCKEISRRLPTDFESDAVLLIKDKLAFIERLKTALLAKLPGWEFLEGGVYYFDPYNDIPKDINQEFWKHFTFAYQKEHRCILRPRQLQNNFKQLSPFFVEIGALDDISEMVVIS